LGGVTIAEGDMMQQRNKSSWRGYAILAIILVCGFFLLTTPYRPGSNYAPNNTALTATALPAVAPARPAQQVQPVQPTANSDGWQSIPGINPDTDPFTLSYRGELTYWHGGNCQIKGNISASGEKIYHVPSGQFYQQTEINPERGERWFCEEEHAKRNGWRASQR
jgi:hypothetical protein